MVGQTWREREGGDGRSNLVSSPGFEAASLQGSVYCQRQEHGGFTNRPQLMRRGGGGGVGGELGEKQKYRRKRWEYQTGRKDRQKR
jgi:hypothetical protein